MISYLEDQANDELYSGAGDDILFGSKGADYFDCGEGYDTIIDFAPTKGDTNSDNCEVVLTHGFKNTEIICDAGSESTKFQSKIKSEMGLNKSVTSSRTISIPNPLDMLCDDDEGDDRFLTSFRYLIPSGISGRSSCCYS